MLMHSGDMPCDLSNRNLCAKMRKSEKLSVQLAAPWKRAVKDKSCFALFYPYGVLPVMYHHRTYHSTKQACKFCQNNSENGVFCAYMLR